MLKFIINATIDKPSRRINGAVYPPLAVSRAEQAVATKDASIRLKFIMLKLVEKCFVP